MKIDPEEGLAISIEGIKEQGLTGGHLDATLKRFTRKMTNLCGRVADKYTAGGARYPSLFTTQLEPA